MYQTQRLLGSHTRSSVRHHRTSSNRYKMSDNAVDSSSIQGLEEELSQFFADWKEKRRNTVQVLRDVGKTIQQHRRNVNIAKLTGVSASLIGAGLSIAGGTLAFFTFGVSLILTGVGVGIGSLGGITAGGAGLAENLLSKSEGKTAQKAVDDDWEAAQHVNDLHEKLNKAYTTCGAAKQAGKIGCAIKNAVGAGVGIGKAAFTGGKAVFSGLSNAARAFHIVGMTVSIVLIPLDVYTLVKTSCDVHKGSIPDVVNDINETADALEAELKELGGNERLMKKDEEEERPTKDEEDETQMKEENDRQKKQSSA